MIYTEENPPPTNTIIIAIYDIKGTPVKKDDAVLCMGKITNMKGHITFIHKQKAYWGYHPDNFRKAKDEEL